MSLRSAKIKRIAMLSIGQSLHDSPTDSDYQSLQSDLMFCYPLDSYSKHELVNKLGPGTGDFSISAPTSDGARVTVSKEKLLPIFNSAIEELEKAGVQAIVIDCTGDFSQLCLQTARLILPGKLLSYRVVSQIGYHGLPTKQQADSTGFVLTLVPIPEQSASLASRWKSHLPGSRIKVSIISPLAPLSDFSQLGSRTAEDGKCTGIVMDCFGYSLIQREAVVQGLRGAGCQADVFSAKKVTLDEMENVLET